MATLGRYCKAYTFKQLRTYPGWGNRAAEKGDDEIAFLQENHTVTTGIFLDDGPILSKADVSPEWVAYCRDHLAFAPEQANAS